MPTGGREKKNTKLNPINDKKKKILVNKFLLHKKSDKRNIFDNANTFFLFL